MLRLPRNVADLFVDWLRRHFPHRAERVLGHIRDMHDGRLYDPQFGKRMRGSGPYAELVEQRFQVAMKKLGLAHRVPKLNCDLFQPPRKSSDQLDFFDN
jgi:DNA repair photolyase